MTPYWQSPDGRHTLFCADCLALLPALTAGSVDAVVTDPPYGQSNESYDRGVKPEVWAECFRVAGPVSALLSFAGNSTYHRIATGIEQAAWKVRQMWGWVYRNGFMTSAYPTEGYDRLAPAMDPICFAAKGKLLLNLSKEGNKTWTRKRNKGEVCTWSERAGKCAGEGVGKWPRAVVSDGMAPFEYFALNPNSPALAGSKAGHPNQKPIALMEWILWKLPSVTILDPFAGSGTTLVACVRTGRRSIGVEIDPKYCAIAVQRMERELAQPTFQYADVAPQLEAATLFGE